MSAAKSLTVACVSGLVVSCGARTALDAPVTRESGLLIGIEAGFDAEVVAGLAPIDPACSSTNGYTTVFPPYVPLVPPDLPASCGNGFELGDAVPGSTYTLSSSLPGGAPASTLDVDFATYERPDGILITGIGASGEYTLLDSCRLQTYDQSDPSGGTSRPPDQTIRQFRIQVEAGTQQLVFSFAGVVSPMYLQVLGLCAFDVVPFADARWWQAVP